MTIKKNKARGPEPLALATEEPTINWPELNLVIQYLPVKELVHYKRNSRTHTDEQIDKLALSMSEIGFVVPIGTDGKKGILSGHARALAAERLGMKMVPTVDLSHLTPVQQKKYIVMDNSLAINGSGWNLDHLKVEIQDLDLEGVRLSDLNFTDDFLKDLLEGEEESELESPSEPEEPPKVVSQEGDVWMLSTHEIRVVGHEACYALDRAIELWQRLTGRQALLDSTGDAYFLVKKKRTVD